MTASTISAAKMAVRRPGFPNPAGLAVRIHSGSYRGRTQMGQAGAEIQFRHSAGGNHF
jgi:hypothetical protein